MNAIYNGFSITNTTSDEMSSIGDVYFIYTVKNGNAQIGNDPCFREKDDGFRLLGPSISKFFKDKNEAIEYGKDLMWAHIAGQKCMRQKFRDLLDV